MRDFTSNETWSTFYPRPMHRRDSFFPLDRGWKLNGIPITVPWPPQAGLSEYGTKAAHSAEHVERAGRSSASGSDETCPRELEYTVSFTLPEGFATERDRLLLHFGAADQVCVLYVNGREIGRHEGGYLPFSFDITESLQEENNQIVLQVTDDLSHEYPYGKQTRKPHGMWYTAVSGIWQTVWLEAAPGEHAITEIRITPDLRGISLEVETDAPEYQVMIPQENGESLAYVCREKKQRLEIPEAHLWTPEDPYLYGIRITTDTDEVESYFALRTFLVQRIGEYARFCLNGQPIFLHGVLDQGYYQDGIFLPGEPQEYERDILRMKALGFNMLRKHIKIEPEAFYYYCDRHGMLVLQDMVNSGGYSFLWDTVIPNFTCKWRPDTIHLGKRGRVRRHFFEIHMLDTLRELYNHPCIVGYTIFNEGWGQFDSDRLYGLCRELDSTRFYDSTSGWFAQKKSDVQSEHLYFRNRILRAKRPDKALLLSECGGYTREVAEHEGGGKKSYGYGAADSEELLTQKLLRLYDETVLPSIPLGLSGCIYTQLADVEGEINGLYTYDREICKVDREEMLRLSDRIRERIRNALEMKK